jgi:ribonucleotide monophosphatase NagD (HAD superfamily)
MIGDNPSVDIKGANNFGWNSILVRTGMFQGKNDEENPAKFVVDNVKDAVELIMNIENI